MWFESGDPDRQVKNLGKAVVDGGRYTVNVSSYPIFRLGNYGKVGGVPPGGREKETWEGCTWWLLREEEGWGTSVRVTKTFSCFCHLAAIVLCPWHPCADVQCKASGFGQGLGRRVALCTLCGTEVMWTNLSSVSSSEKSKLRRAQFCWW